MCLSYHTLLLSVLRVHVPGDPDSLVAPLPQVSGIAGKTCIMLDFGDGLCGLAVICSVCLVLVSCFYDSDFSF